MTLLAEKTTYFVNTSLILLTAVPSEERRGCQGQSWQLVQECFQCGSMDHLKNQCRKHPATGYQGMAAGRLLGPNLWLPPFKVGLQQRVASQQQYLHGQKATALANRHEPFHEDHVTGHCSSSDFVDSDYVHNDLSCLNVSAPVFYPKGLAQSVSDVLNDSAYLRSSHVRGFCPGSTGMVVGSQSSTL